MVRPNHGPASAPSAVAWASSDSGGNVARSARVRRLRRHRSGVGWRGDVWGRLLAPAAAVAVPPLLTGGPAPPREMSAGSWRSCRRPPHAPWARCPGRLSGDSAEPLLTGLPGACVLPAPLVHM